MTHLIDPAAPAREDLLPAQQVDAWERGVRQALAEVVAELVDGMTTSTSVDRLIEDPTDERWGWRRVVEQHVVHHASLLLQLGRAVEGSSQLDGDAVRGLPGSRPSARIDALVVKQRIERESIRWALTLGVDARQPVFGRLEGLVDRAVAGEAGRDDRGRTLLAAARSWRAAARVTTGWDSRPFAPRVPCPEVSCEEVGTLRVRLDSATAVCLHCGATWDEDLVEGLAFYVSWAAEHELHTAVRPVSVAVFDGAGRVLRPAVEAVHEVAVPVLDEHGEPVLDRGRPRLQLVACTDCAQAREQMAANRRARAAAAAAHVTTGELMPVQAVEGAVHDDVVAARRRHEQQVTTA